MRTNLPNRRPNATQTVQWGAHSFTVCIGYDAAGKPAEVFCDHAKGELAAMLADACVLISLALQWGVTPEALGKSLGTVPDYVLGEPVDVPASPIGAIVEALRMVEVMG